MTAAQSQTPSRPQAVLRAVSEFARERYGVRVRHVSIDASGNRVTLWLPDDLRRDRVLAIVIVEDDGEGVRVVDVEIVRPKRRARGT